MVHVAQPHCCWAVSEWSHVHLWASLQALHILRTAAVTCTCLVKEHQSGSCIIWVCYPGKCTDPAAVSFRWCEAVSGHNSMLDCWCYIKHDASRPWSCLCYSGRLLFSPPKHLSSILNSRGKKDVSLMKARISPSCSVTAEDKEEALPALSCWKQKGGVFHSMLTGGSPAGQSLRKRSKGPSSD